jgi:hypothetical protein
MRSIFSCLLAFLAGCAGEAPATPVGPPPTKSANTMDNLSTRLNAFDTRPEDMREKLRIPALALVIVKDGDIVYLKGKGYRNLEEPLPATEDTLFAIGSTTKAFTALLVLMGLRARGRHGNAGYPARVRGCHCLRSARRGPCELPIHPVQPRRPLLMAMMLMASGYPTSSKRMIP